MLFFYLLVGILPLSDHHVLGKSFGGITLFKVLGAVCLIYAVIYRASRGGAIQYFQTWRSRLSVLFLFFTVASLLITIDTRTTDYSVLWSCASQLAFFVTAISLVDSVPRL